MFRHNGHTATASHPVRNGQRDLIHEILASAGIEINGPMPWDLRINDERFYHRILIDGSLGLGESYMDGWWDCDRIDEFFNRDHAPRPAEEDKERLASFIPFTIYITCQSKPESQSVCHREETL